MHRALVPASIGTISATAWVVIWWMGDSPSGRWSHAHGWTGHSAMADAAMGTFAAAFLASWVAMTVAMMLPTTVPLVQIFRRLTAGRADRPLLVLLLMGGYVSAWMACGTVVFGASLPIRALAGTSEWLAGHPTLPTALLFLVAGAFQFSRLKHRCLDRCRSPLSFVTSRWRGAHERWHSFRLGVEHGIFCVGCCWALMLLMFVSGVSSLLWMIALGGIMAVEKNAPWGRRLSTPVGLLLLAAGLGVLLT